MPYRSNRFRETPPTERPWPKEKLVLRGDPNIPIELFPTFRELVLENLRQKHRSYYDSAIQNYLYAISAESDWQNLAIDEDLRKQITSFVDQRQMDEVDAPIESARTRYLQLTKDFIAANPDLSCSKEEISHAIDLYTDYILCINDVESTLLDELQSAYSEAIAKVGEASIDSPPEQRNRLIDSMLDTLFIKHSFEESNDFKSLTATTEKKLLDLSDAAIHLVNYVVEHKCNKIVFLDRSARLLAQLFRSLWKEAHQKIKAYPSAPLPAIRFLNIGLELQHEKLDNNPVFLDQAQSILQPEDGDVLLIIDVSLASGNTLANALELIKASYGQTAGQFHATIPTGIEPQWCGSSQYSEILSDEASDEIDLLFDPTQVLPPPIQVASRSIRGFVRDTSPGLNPTDQDILAQYAKQITKNTRELRLELAQLTKLTYKQCDSVASESFTTEPRLPLEPDFDFQVNNARILRILAQKNSQEPEKTEY